MKKSFEKFEKIEIFQNKNLLISVLCISFFLAEMDGAN